MALEWRGNNLYYYSKERSGGRVVSSYSGKGEMALLMHHWQRLKRDEEEIKREVAIEERKRYAGPNELIETFCREVEALEKVLHLVNGYHQHSRSWRRRRKATTQK